MQETQAKPTCEIASLLLAIVLTERNLHILAVTEYTQHGLVGEWLGNHVPAHYIIFIVTSLLTLCWGDAVLWWQLNLELNQPKPDSSSHLYTLRRWCLIVCLIIYGLINKNCPAHLRWGGVAWWFGRRSQHNVFRCRLAAPLHSSVAHLSLPKQAPAVTILQWCLTVSSSGVLV